MLVLGARISSEPGRTQCVLRGDAPEIGGGQGLSRRVSHQVTGLPTILDVSSLKLGDEGPRETLQRYSENFGHLSKTVKYAEFRLRV